MSSAARSFSPADNRASPFALAALRVLLGGVLLYAGVAKIKSGHEFAEAIANFALLPAAGNQILAVVLPWWEICAGALLVFGVWTRAAGLVTLLLFLSFTLAVTSALVRGLDIQCGCFSDAGSRVGLKALAIDLAGLAAAIVLVRSLRQTHNR